MGSTFNRECRYLVFKRKDIDLYLTPEEKATVLALADKVAKAREADKRVAMDCVVVERDWPESEAVWSMIEARMTGGVNFVDWQAHRLFELEQQVAELNHRLGITEEITHA